MSNENTVLAEALAAAGEIQVSPPKIPEGKTLIGIQLSRDPAVSNRFMTSIGTHWRSEGMAAAIRDGNVVAANYIFGRITKGVPKVTACHYVTCCACGRKILQPEAVWAAKDAARRQNVEIGKDERGMRILRRYGRCPCGGLWDIDESAEKAELDAFAEKVLDAYSNAAAVSRFLGPVAWNVVPDVPGKPVPAEWQWAEDALAKTGRHLATFVAGTSAPAILFNPGFWLGWVDDADQTGLFWVEDGKTPGLQRESRFNPCSVDGL